MTYDDGTALQTAHSDGNPVPEGVWVGLLDALDGAPDAREEDARIAREAWRRVRRATEVGRGAK